MTKGVEYLRSKLFLTLKIHNGETHRTLQEENGNWVVVGLLPRTIGGAFRQSDFNRHPRVFLTNHMICFRVVVGVTKRVDNRTAGTVIGNKLDGCRQLAMLPCVSIRNTTNKLPHQVILEL